MARRKARSARWRSVRSGHRQRGISEIIGTVLILAIALVLIAVIFAFVLKAPAQPTAPTSEFTVALQRNATAITNVSITYVVGPSLPASSTTLTKIEITSAAKPSVIPSPFSVAQGHVSPTVEWNPGETWWHLLGAYTLPASDNLTVQVISGSRLIFHTTAPGPQVVTAPYFLSVWTTPTALVHGTTYTVFATIAVPDGLAGTGSVKVDASLANGPATPQTMVAGNTSGEAYWSYTPSTYPTSAGTYTVYLLVTDSLGAKATDVLHLTFS